MIPFSRIVSSVVEKVSPSVVCIGKVELERDGRYAVPKRGLGSGVIINNRGHILTNHHVIMEAHRITVTLADGKKLPAKPVGSDTSVDIAVIKTKNEGLQACKLGDSDKLKIGQLVVAIGKPFGFQLVGPTVTVGIISALNQRLVGEEEKSVGWIQTDAAINPGNSGGPLVDEFGSVIGINTAGLGGDWDTGINFAVPINIARKIAEGLIAHRENTLPWTGIFGLDITRETSAYYNLSHGGVLVIRVAANGPANKAGITAGDAIVEIDGLPLKTMDELLKEINRRKVGDSVKLMIKRGETMSNVEIVLEEKP